MLPRDSCSVSAATPVSDAGNPALVDSLRHNMCLRTFAQVRCCRFEQRELCGYCLGRAKPRCSKRHSGVERVDVDSVPCETLLFADSRLCSWLRRPKLISYIVLACFRSCVHLEQVNPNSTSAQCEQQNQDTDCPQGSQKTHKNNLLPHPGTSLEQAHYRPA